MSAEIPCKTVFDTREPMQNHDKYERETLRYDSKSKIRRKKILVELRRNWERRHHNTTIASYCTCEVCRMVSFQFYWIFCVFTLITSVVCVFIDGCTMYMYIFICESGRSVFCLFVRRNVPICQRTNFEKGVELEEQLMNYFSIIHSYVITIWWNTNRH